MFEREKKTGGFRRIVVKDFADYELVHCDLPVISGHE